MEEVQAATTVATTISTEVWILIIGAVVSCASSILSALIPMPKEGSSWAFVRKIIDFLAVNIGHAKNVK